MTDEKESTPTKEAHREDAKASGEEVHKPNNVGSLRRRETTCLLVGVAQNILENSVRERQDDVDSGQFVEDHCSDINPTCSYIPFISDIGLLQSCLLRVITAILPSELSLDRHNDLLSSLIVALYLVYLMDRTHGLAGLAAGNVESWSVIRDYNQEAEQNQGIIH